MEPAPLRILHVSSSTARGGAERRMIELARSLEDAGTRNFIASPPGAYMFRRARELGMEARALRFINSLDLLALWKLRRIVRQDRIDIIHSHQGKTYWPCILVKWLSHSRTRVVLHRRVLKPHKFFSRSHYRFSGAVITVSRAVGDQLVAREKVPRRKIRVIYNGIDCSMFSPAVSGERVRRAYRIEENLVVGTAGNLDPVHNKGQRVLIEAAETLAARFPHVRYLIVGEGDHRPAFERLSDRLGVADKIIFTGYQDPILEYLAAMDIFCLLSWRGEGVGHVVAEAQAMGKPAVATDVGGIPETLVHEKTGFVIPSRNVQALAAALERLFREERLREEMGTRARAFIRTNFSVETMVRSTLQVYRGLLPAGRIPPPGPTMRG